MLIASTLTSTSGKLQRSLPLSQCPVMAGFESRRFQRVSAAVPCYGRALAGLGVATDVDTAERRPVAGRVPTGQAVPTGGAAPRPVSRAGGQTGIRRYRSTFGETDGDGVQRLSTAVTRSTRVGNWFKQPGLNHGLNRLKSKECMPLAGINSILPGLNWFKPVKTTGWHKSIQTTGWHKSNLSRLFPTLQSTSFNTG